VEQRASRARRRPEAVRITDRDRELLAFAAEHRLVLGQHIEVLLGVSERVALGRLRALTQAGFLARRAVFERGPTWYQIRRPGLAVIGSSLPRPRKDLRSYDHDVGVAWLWLAARDGAFGRLEEVLGERRMRSGDAGRDPRAEPSGVRRVGVGPRGGERLHYPDLLLRTADGRRLALELELSPKGRTRLETILSGYAADQRIDGVVYLVESRTLARKIASAARRVGVADLVFIQPVSRPDPARTTATSRVAERTRATSRGSAGRGDPRAVDQGGARTTGGAAGRAAEVGR
jgi:hypothetical protein